jgi:hypothetical protein
MVFVIITAIVLGAMAVVTGLFWVTIPGKQE